MINFNSRALIGNEVEYIREALESDKISGDGQFGLRCQSWFEQQLGSVKTLLTPSCTHALEMAAILADIQPGDEVIMASYTFVSTANAFVLRGAKIVFVDIRPDTLNLDESLIEAAITPRTKAIVPMHYAGVACDMQAINLIAARHGLIVIEDAAQGVMSTYRDKPLGTLGHFAAYSFHETKNITSGGEGGLLIINDDRFVHRAEIIREKGANRSQFFRGMVDKYTWVDVGSSYLPSELQAAYLFAQLEKAEDITANRLATWDAYYSAFVDLQVAGNLELAIVPNDCRHNGHMFYLKCGDLSERTALLAHLKTNGIVAVFHYIPLHAAPAGQKFGRFNGEDRFTTVESERLLRLPIYYGMEEVDRHRVIDKVREFYA